MSALLIGSLLVILSAAVFGYALFGSRPVPQPATAGESSEGANRLETGVSESAHSESASTEAAAVTTETQNHPDSTAVGVRWSVRLRSAAMLVLGAVGTAVVLGAILSIIVVGLILVVA